MWRRQHLPGVNLAYRCSSMLGVAQLVRAGMGVAALPDFMLRDSELQPIGGALDGYDTGLWLLTRPDCRALRSVSALFRELTQAIELQEKT
jgi:DNA-binding transcriptional LysR family regulator